MRRLVTVCSLAMLAVCVSPVPAHAYFWEWLDSLSGPKFAGASVEVKVWCQTDRRSEVIDHIRTRLGERSQPYRTLLQPTAEGLLSARIAFARRGVMAADMANSLLEQADAAANDKTRSSRYDPSELFFEALRWRDYAYIQFAWADRAENLSDDVQRAALLQGLPTPRVLEKTQPGPAALAGLSFSVCPAEAIDRHKRSLNLTVGYGWDQKEAHQADNNRMLTFSASYDFVVAPWLTLGFGAGVAHFRSDTAETFSKGFVQPWIIDVRPFAFNQQKYSPEAWRQIWFVRISSITFPGGFDAGQFTGSPKLRTELVHSIGIHADLDPIIRKARLRW